jgi:hypothetical protein
MKIFIKPYLAVVVTITLFSACGPKTVVTERQDLYPQSIEWIPYIGNEDISFIYDTNEMAYSASGKLIYYDYLRYKTDQGGLFEGQKDYFADFERQTLSFISEATPYFITYFLERNKGELGDWDVFKVSVGDGDYYKNEIKIITYESDDSNKGEDFDFKSEITLNGITFDSVYFKKQDRRPFELYYTKKLGVIAFKVSATEIWVLNYDTLSKAL